nr:amylo-alpha-1,6-glucosidase [Altererythrobacter sp. C41]
MNRSDDGMDASASARVDDTAAQPAAECPERFAIPAASSLHERRPRTLKHGDTFAVFDHSGDAIAGPGSPEGIYHRDTRYLSHFHLTLCDARPILLSSSLRDDNVALNCDLSNPDLSDARGERTLSNDLIHIRRVRFLWQGAMYERLTVGNYDRAAHTLSLELYFEADFADLFEVRGSKRERRGTIHEPVVGPDRVRLSYDGLDGVHRATEIRFEPAPQSMGANRARFLLELEPRSSRTLIVRISCGDGADGTSLRRELIRAYRNARRELRDSSSRAASILASNEVFNRSVQRCVADTYMLVTETPHGPYPYAGIPWYSTVFGRDALITALETLWLDPEIAGGVLRYLAAHQARTFDPVADAEPGKILHEVRQGEMAELGEVPFRHYYGSIDSTPLFVMTAGAYLERTGDGALIEALWPNIEAALGWIERYGDRDGDGYVEYGRHTDEGLANQGWKDSHDSIFHADGSLAVGPIALAEVQAYVYGAWQAAAAMLYDLGDEEGAEAYRTKAGALRDRFDRDFFDEELGTYVPALDGRKRACRVKSSNAGHVLFTGLALPERAPPTAHTLMEPASFSGWGIRTIAAGQPRYNPMSYHNGSIWPHENAIIAAGLARYGLRREASAVFEGLFAASTYVDLRRLPELFCGFSRRPAQGPTFYPVSCIPQAWAAAAPLFLIQSSLGLSLDAAAREILFDQPHLPQFLDDVYLRNLTVAGARADIMLHRSGNKVLVDVRRREGDVRVIARV